MRPRKLHLEGFTCFADAVDIDFTSMDVFVICGPTGAGKTTLVDAMCYALYGRIPRHDGTSQLMSHNRDRMVVSLEFDAAGGRYRVLRSINVTRRSKRDGSEDVRRTTSPVQFERYVAAKDEWQPEEGRVREIDAEIERIVGLDFKGFTRCVLLPQGRFQEFLAGERADRRDVLTELLDIGIYEQIMRTANARAAGHAKEAEGIQRRLDEDYRDATAEALDACRAELEQTRPALDEARGRRDALVEGKGHAKRVMDARKRQRERELARDTKRAEVAEREREAETGQQQLAGLRAAVTEAERELAEIAYDPKAHAALSAALDRARDVDRKTKQLAAAKDVAANTSAADAAEAAVREREGERDAAAAALDQAAERREQVQRAEAAAHVRAGLKPGDVCPVCGGAVGKLPKDGKVDVKAAEKAVRDAETARKRADDAFHSARIVLERARQQMKQSAADVARISGELAAATAALKAALPRGLAADVAAIAAALEAQSAAEKHAAALRKAIADARMALAELEPRVAESDQKIAALKVESESLDAEARSAMADAESAKKALIKLAKTWEWTEALALIEAKKDPSTVFAKALGDGNADVDRLTAKLTALEERERHVETAIERAAELREELEALRARAELLRQLAHLLRADQFQEFVITEAMGILAAAATEHLQTLFPRFAIDVDGSEFLVVDHWQADQRRSARTLSGGETFVASLALALALSERLPELRSAAGAALESLFLDEGFGTLDPETLETVITALEGLRSEDRMVGIITHVPELARRIETRIEVIRSPSASSVQVVGAPG